MKVHDGNGLLASTNVVRTVIDVYGYAVQWCNWT